MRRVQHLMRKSPIIATPQEAHRWLRFLKETQDSQHTNNSTRNAQRWAPAAIRCILTLKDNLVSYHEIDAVIPDHMNTQWTVSYLMRIGFLEKRGNRSYYRINRGWEGNGNGGEIEGNGGQP